MKRFHYINGYVLRYEPGHARAFNNSGHEGYVYEHILVVERYVRPLRRGEVVHHLDFVRSNNAPENLLIMDRDQHLRLHAWINVGLPILGKARLSKTLKEIKLHEQKKHKDYGIVQIRRCATCEYPLANDCVQTCSWKCEQVFKGENSGLVKNGLTQKKLERLLTKYSWVALGKKYNVSDNAVRKWARKLGIDPKKYRHGKVAA